MALSTVRTHAAQELLAGEVDLLRELVSQYGEAVLVVPSRAAAEAHRREAACAGLVLGLDVLTPAGLVERLWELAGDGRRIVSPAERLMLVDSVLRATPEQDLAPMRFNPGTVRLAARAARDMLPWIAGPLPEGRASAAVPTGLSGAASQRLAQALRRYAEELDRRSLIEGCAASVILAEKLGSGRKDSLLPLAVPAVAVRDVTAFPAHFRLLLEAVASASEAVLLACDGQASFVRDAAAGVCPSIAAEADIAGSPSVPGPAGAGSEELFLRLADASGESAGGRIPAPWLSFSKVAGPSAREAAYACLIASCCREAASKDDEADVLVVAPDPLRAFSAVSGRLARAGIRASAAGFAPFERTQAGRTLFTLADLADRMRDGAAASWWPAPELADWLSSPLSGLTLAQARAFDKKLRGKRQLSADAVMRALQSAQAERCRQLAEAGVEDVPPVVAFDVVHALSRGRFAEALSLIADASAAAARRSPSNAALDLERAASARAVEFLSSAREAQVPVESALAALKDLSVHVSVESALSEGACAAAHARFASLAEAAEEPGGSVRCLVMLDVGAEEYPLAPREGADILMARELGCETLALQPAALVRERFRRAFHTATDRVALARIAHDRQGDELYPAATWTELEGISSPAEPPVLPDEGDLSRNLSDHTRVETVPRSYAESLSEVSLPRLLPLVRGADGDLRPRRFSASQIENYLSCPYQWFLSSRVAPRDVDAGFGNLEKGNLVHDVMQRFHEELSRRDPGRVTPFNLGASLDLLGEVFRAVREEHARGKTASSGALVPLTRVEEMEADSILRELRQAVALEADLLPPFRPMSAEYSFDSLDVTYAGVPLGGRIDRIDVDPDGRAVVLDYKHRSSISEFRLSDPTDGLEPDEVLDPAWLPRHVQTLVYAQAVRRALGLDVQGALYFGTRGPSFAGAVADALADMVPGMRHGFPGPSGSLEFTDLLDLVEERVAVRLSELAAGEIAPSDDALSCAFCPAFGCPRRKE